MPTLRSRRAEGGDAGLLVSGVALIAAAAALAFTDGRHDPAALSLVIGVGLCVSAPFARRGARVRSTLLVALLCTFVAARLGALVAQSDLSLAAVARLAAEGLIVGVVFALVYSRAHGLAQVAALFHGREAGYAPVVDEDSAARSVEAELARSRRHGTVLSFLVLEPRFESAGPEFEATLGRLSLRARAELERLYLQQRSCRLISEHVRRSDAVVCSEATRFLVLSTDTGAAGTELLANRLIDTIRGGARCGAAVGDRRVSHRRFDLRRSDRGRDLGREQ